MNVVFRTIDSNGLSAELAHDPAEIRVNPLASGVAEPALPILRREDDVIRQVHVGHLGTLSFAPSGLFPSLAAIRGLAPPATCCRPFGPELAVFFRPVGALSFSRRFPGACAPGYLLPALPS